MAEHPSADQAAEQVRAGREVEVRVVARNRSQFTAEGVVTAASTGDPPDHVPPHPQLEAVGTGQERVGPRVDVDGRADGEHVVEREHQGPGVLARVEPAPDRATPPTQGTRLPVRPGAGAAQHPDGEQPAVALLERDVVDVAEHLLLAAEQLVVEQAQPEGQRGAGLDRLSGGGVSGHCPAPVTTMRGIAARETTTTTNR